MNASFFKSIFETSAEGILVVDANGTINMANAACETLFGYGHGQLNGIRIDTLISEKNRNKDASQREHYTSKSRDSKDMIDGQFLGRRKNGDRVQLEISRVSNNFKGESLIVFFLKVAIPLKSDVALLEKSNLILAEVNRKYSTLIGNLRGIVYRCQNDGDRTMEYISAGCERITGYAQEEFLSGKVHFSQIILKEDRERVRKEAQEAVLEKSHYNLTFRIRNKNGTIKYMQELGQGIFDEDGTLEALEGFLTDISPQKEMERVLQESEARNKGVLEALPDLLFMIDEKGNFIDVHSPDSSLLIAPKGTLIGTKIADYLPKQLCANIMDAFLRSKKTGTPQVLELQFPIDNNLRYFESRIVAMSDHRFLMLSRDIHERKKVENILFVRNRALASAGNGILITDAKVPDLPIIYANQAFYKMTGYQSDDVLGRNCRFLQNDDRDQEVIATMAKAIKKGEACQVVLRNYKKDGTLFWNELTITPVHNNEGDLTHFIGVQNDVTDRKNGEALKDHIRKILEMMAQQKSLKSIGKEIVSTSESSIEGGLAFILKLDPKNKTLHQLVAPSLPKRFIGAVEGMRIGPDKGPCASAAFHKKAVVVSDLEKDGRWKGFVAIALKDGLRACWSYPVLSSDNQVLGLFSIYHKTTKTPSPVEKEIIENLVQLTSVALEQDRVGEELKKSRWLLEDYAKELEHKVTERTNELKATVRQLVETNMKLKDQVQETKVAENKALESQAMFTSISKNFPKGIIAVFNTDFEIVYIDGGEIARLGFEKHQFEGLAIDDIDIFSQKRIDRIKTDIKKTFEGQQLSFEMKYRNKTYTVNTSPLATGNSEVKWALFVYNDISKQKQAEDDMRSALVREQELNVLKSRFISMASHEFRTPLSAINTSAILIGKQHAPDKVERREKYVEQIQKNVRNLVTILNDFLSLGRLEEGKVVPKPEVFNFLEFTNQLVNEMEPNRKRGQTINVSVDQDVIEVYLDPKLLQHILTNLLSNAIKYSGEGDEISVSLKKSGEIVRLEILDQGIGIPKGEQVNIFERFFRAENSTNIEGTGLGLHIVKQYTELMGGKVGFESKEGQGATFWVEFKVL